MGPSCGPRRPQSWRTSVAPSQQLRPSSDDAARRSLLIASFGRDRKSTSFMRAVGAPRMHLVANPGPPRQPANAAVVAKQPRDPRGRCMGVFELRPARRLYVFCSALRDKDLSGEHIVVVGFGVSGVAATRLALHRGATVTVVDSNPKLDVDTTEFDEEPNFDIQLGPDTSAVKSASRLVLSPGVPMDSKPVQTALQAGVPITSELAFACEVLSGANTRIIAVTGTNGKSTVTWFTYQLLQHIGVKTWAGGNLGTPASSLALDVRNGACVDVAVIEVSSYQLEVPSSFCPNAGALLNLTPDHLERHGTMEAYAAVKCQLFRNMSGTDTALLPAGDGILHGFATQSNPDLMLAFIGKLPGVRVLGQHASIELPGKPALELDMRIPNCRATHNLINAAVGAALVLSLELPELSQAVLEEGISKLQGLPHRMQVLGTINGVEWINDSKATNVEAAASGIGGLEKPAVILLGGLAKQIPGATSLGFQRLSNELACHRGVVVFGHDGMSIAQELLEDGVHCRVTRNLIDAVEVAKQLARPGDAVLLSPGCASFDEFQSFEHRGNTFAELAGFSS